MSYTPGRPPYLTDNYGFPVPGGTGLADYLTANRAFADKVDSQLKTFETMLDELVASHSNYVANLPTVGLVDGEEVYYQTSAMATAGALWHLRYRAAAQAGARWEFLGGSPVEQTINGGAGNSGIWIGPLASGLNPVPDGPSVVVPRPGDYLLSFGATVQHPAGTSVDIGVDGGGLAANTAPMLQFDASQSFGLVTPYFIGTSSSPFTTANSDATLNLLASRGFTFNTTYITVQTPGVYLLTALAVGLPAAGQYIQLSLCRSGQTLAYGVAGASPDAYGYGNVSCSWACTANVGDYFSWKPYANVGSLSPVQFGVSAFLLTAASDTEPVVANPGGNTGSLTVRRNVATANSTLSMWASPSADGVMVGARYLSVTPIRLG